jgi:hypothetical protein
LLKQDRFAGDLTEIARANHEEVMRYTLNVLFFMYEEAKSGTPECPCGCKADWTTAESDIERAWNYQFDKYQQNAEKSGRPVPDRPSGPGFTDPPNPRDTKGK